MKKGRRIFINFYIIFVTLVIITLIIVEDNSENKIEKKEENYNVQSLSLEYYNNSIQEVDDVLEKDIIKTEKQNENKEIIEDNINEYKKEKVEKEYKGYKVAARLKIQSINLDTYILEPYSNNALNVSVTKFWGANPNEVGNLCIAGHNFQNKNMFHNLKKVKIGDIISVIDNKNGSINYKIYDIYKVNPQDVSCLSQETNGKKELTLITCTNDSKKRIIVKATEI